ncbi:MAG TPA: 2-oxo-tetronate isomerase [Stellaceae bacterium]|nr:2-oxo-tetronate isomerase [Stellaceae bacterium]
MPKFAANLSMMFQEVGFLDRFGAAAKAGFRGVEYLFPYDFAAADIADRLRRHELTQALFNLPPGNWGAGERGVAALPGREAEFREGVERAIHYAKATGCRTLHAMAGLWPQERPRAEGEEVYVANLRHAADAMAPHGITLVIEPINTRDIPGYFLNTTTQGIAILDRVARPNARLQLDLYHCQIMEGDLAERIKRLLPRVGHVQIAGNPGRFEPDVGEINYPFLYDLLDELGYQGWIGCEYRPKAGTLAGLGWAKRYGIGG